MKTSLKKKRSVFTLLSFYLLITCFICYSNSFAQQKWGSSSFKATSWKSSFDSNKRIAESQKISNGTMHIVAVMVEFQPDSNRFTTGNGLFNPEYLDTSSIVIDPLPHNRNYFEAHLEFVKNYYESASKNQLQITYEVIPTVYRLDEEMSYYSPTGPDNSNDYKLAWLLRDTWSKVNNDNSVVTTNWDANTMFVVFHAGAGRDFDFLNTTLDRTPQDIPSLYLSENSIAKLLDDSAFKGFSVKGFRVKNSGIMPETESRTGEFLDEPFVLQLAINGLLTAIVGNHIGLPDLYNTSDGTSGIGRFGLMDPEGFFAHFGLFPPLPSAWERVYMGWENTFNLPYSFNSKIELNSPGVGISQSIAKIPISQDEYFLVENRHRNANGTGITIKIQQPDGAVIQQTFTESDTRFTSENLDSLLSIYPKGVLIDTDNFDWSLPGGLDAGSDGKYFTSDDRILNGGLLIWHIDETVIRQGLTSNSINASLSRRGVDLEEADGAQDIGNSTNNLFLESVTGGTSFDFWWSGNNYTVITEQGDSLRAYTNKFAPNTRPSTASNAGATVPFEIYNISSSLPTASFYIRPYAQQIQIDTRFDSRRINSSITQIDTSLAYPLHPLIYAQGADSFLVIPSKNGLFAAPFNGANTSDYQKLANSVFRQPILFQNQLIVAIGKSEIASFEFTGGNWVTNWSTDISELIIGSLSISNSKIDIERSQLYLSPNDGSIEFLTSKPLIQSSLNGKSVVVTSSDLQFDGVSYPINSIRMLSNRMLLSVYSFGTQEVIQLHGNYLTAFYPDGYTLLEGDKTLLTPLYEPNDVDVKWLSTNNSQLLGRYSNGTVASNYPLQAFNKSFIGNILLVDLDGDGTQERIAMIQDSLQVTLTAFYSNNETVEGFPVVVGPKKEFDPLQPYFNAKRLWVVTTDGFIYSWYFPNSGEVQWGSPYGNRTDGKIELILTDSKTYQNPTELLIKSETYNWPNPSNAATYVRYQTNAEASVHIDVFTLSGSKVWSNQVQSYGLAPQEILLNTSSWGNGLYYIRLQAKASGKTESKIIKMIVEH